jgi:hypothetical protein
MTFEATIGVTAAGLIGLGALAYGLYQRSRLRRCQAWPQAVATVRKTAVIHDSGPDSNGYFVSVLYDYTVDGARYEGSRVGFRDRAYIRKQSAQALADRFPPNTTVPAFYDPEKPAEAVLVREYPDSVLLVVCGIGLLILAGVILVAER